MKSELVLYFLLTLMAFSPCRGLAQQAEYNMGNNWVYPNAQKYIGSDFVNTASGSFMNDGVIWYSRNFENNGAVNCINPVPSTLIQFVGTAQQYIKGTGTTRFYNVCFRNQLTTDAFSLEQDIVVAHQADFTNGVVTAVQSSPEAMTNMFILEDGASWANASDNSYVDGFVRKIGNSAFTFPVGDGGFYRFAAISAPSVATDHFTARYVFADPGLAGYTRASKESSVGLVSNREYWIVNRTNGTSNVQLTLSWAVSKTSATVSEDLDKLQIVRWDGSKWVNEGNVATTGNVNEGTITANISGYGVFTLATAIQLPDNSPPVVTANPVATWANTPVNGEVTATDTDGDALVFTITSDPAYGTVILTIDGAYTYTPEFNYVGGDSFNITVNDGRGGIVTVTVTVSVEEASDCEVFIPNGFSPNGDGIHDYFRITCLDKYENPVIEIYNRWGNLVYKIEHYGDIGFWGSEFKAFWDGKANQSWSSSKGVLRSGTYYYVLKLDNRLKTGSVFINK